MAPPRWRFCHICVWLPDDPRVVGEAPDPECPACHGLGMIPPSAWEQAKAALGAEMRSTALWRGLISIADRVDRIMTATRR